MDDVNKHMLLLLLPLALAPFVAAIGEEEIAAPLFDDYFLDKALRVDIYHVGTSDSERVIIDELKEEKIYPGPRRNLIDAADLGTYRCELRDAETERLIFSRGYCCLFNEWRTIEEARRGTWRALEHVLILPYPRKPVVLTIRSRSPKGTWSVVLEQRLNLEERFISRNNTPAGTKIKPLMINGGPSQKVDLLILGDGYTRKQIGEFNSDAQSLFKSLFKVQPFKERRHDFNVWSVQCPSPESGVDEPRAGIFKKTALDVTFNFFDLERYSLTAAIHDLYDVASLAPHDAIILIFNSPRMGGGGIYNLYAVCSADSPVGNQVLVHELGHALAGLGDEYFSADVTYIDYHPDGVEPWERNLTALLDPRAIKWGHLITKGTPIPTPKDAGRYRKSVGCFEGAGYRAEGLYRPCLDCVMFSLRTSKFCPVCMEAMEERIDFFSDEPRKDDSRKSFR